MIKMWHKKGFTFLAPQEEVKKRLSEGHALLPDQEISVYKADGSGIENVSSEFFVRNLGLNPLRQVDVAKRQSIEESDSFSTGAAALGSSFASGATAGASDWLLRKTGEATGAELEEFAKLTQDKHPLLSKAGNLAGTLYTFVRAGLKLNPVFTKAGEATVKGVAHAFGKAVPKGALGKAGAFTTGLAAEGATIFSGYDVVQRATSKEGLDIAEVPEIIAKNVGLTIFAGVIGAGIVKGAAALGRGTQKVINRITPQKTSSEVVGNMTKKEVAEMSNTLKNLGFDAKTTEKFKNDPVKVFNYVDDLKKQAKKNQRIKNLDDVGETHLLKETQKIVDNSIKDMKALRKVLSKTSDDQMRSLAGTSADVLAKTKGEASKYLFTRNEILNGAFKIIKEHRGVSNAQRESLMNQINGLLGQANVIQKVKGKPSVVKSNYVTYKGVEDLRGALSDLYKESLSQVAGSTNKQRLINRLYGYANGLENNLAKRAFNKENYNKFLKAKKDWEINAPFNEFWKVKEQARLFGKDSLNPAQRDIFDSNQLLYIGIGGIYSAGGSPLVASAGGALLFQTTKEIARSGKVYAGLFPFKKTIAQRIAGGFTGGLDSLNKGITKTIKFNKKFLSRVDKWGTDAYWSYKYSEQGTELRRRDRRKMLEKPKKEALDEAKEKMGIPKGASTEKLIEAVQQASGDMDSFLEAVETPVNAIRAEGFDDIGDEVLRSSLAMKEVITQLAPKPTFRNAMDYENPKYTKKQLKQFEEDMVPLMRPDVTLQDQLDGGYNPEHLKLVKAFYPQFYNRFVMNLMGSIQKMKRPLNNAEKMRVYRLTGFSPDNSVSPESISISSQLMAKDNQQKSIAQDRLNKKIDMKSKLKAIKTQTERGEQWG